MFMLGKRPAPIIGKLLSGAAGVLLDSPTSPLDMKSSSPRGLKGYDLGGVGLKIVVALDDNQDFPKRTLCLPNNNLNHNFDALGSLEDYTCVTCHVPNKTFTKVYYDGGCYNNKDDAALLVRTPSSEPVFPTSNFLSSCHLCRKKLDGKDIYMYRGEKGFCSPECRSRQMMMEERKELCRSEAVEEEHILFSTGILAL